MNVAYGIDSGEARDTLDGKGPKGQRQRCCYISDVHLTQKQLNVDFCHSTRFDTNIRQQVMRVLNSDLLRHRFSEQKHVQTHKLVSINEMANDENSRKLPVVLEHRFGKRSSDAIVTYRVQSWANVYFREPATKLELLSGFSLFPAYRQILASSTFLPPHFNHQTNIISDKNRLIHSLLRIWITFFDCSFLICWQTVMIPLFSSMKRNFSIVYERQPTR